MLKLFTRMRRILLVRTDRIGDVISITPSVRLLRQKFPDAHIAALVSAYAAPVLQDNHDINEIITLGKIGETSAEIKKRGFDTAVLFFVDRVSALTVWRAAIPLRIGPASKVWSLLLNKRIFQHRSQVLRHEADFNKDLLIPLGIEPVDSGVYINVPDYKAKWAEEFLSAQSVTTGPRICIHAGSRGSAKDWPPKRFSELIALLGREMPQAKIFTTGSADEAELVSGIIKNGGGRVCNLAGRLDLAQLIAVISRMDVVVANSTGPLHIAAATGVPTVSFFPRLKGCLPQRWGPYGKGHIVLMPPVSLCDTCDPDTCKQHQCMALIPAEEAFESVRAQLETKVPA